jgi:hypothetical protein
MGIMGMMQRSTAPEEMKYHLERLCKALRQHGPQAIKNEDILVCAATERPCARERIFVCRIAVNQDELANSRKMHHLGRLRKKSSGKAHGLTSSPCRAHDNEARTAPAKVAQ